MTNKQIIYLGDDQRVVVPIKRAIEKFPTTELKHLPYYQNFKDYLEFMQLHSAVLFGEPTLHEPIGQADAVRNDIYPLIFLCGEELSYSQCAKKNRQNVGEKLVSMWNGKFQRYSPGYLLANTSSERVPTISKDTLEAKLSGIISDILKRRSDLTKKLEGGST